MKIPKVMFGVGFLGERKLTYKAREKLPDSSFVYPKERKYPIHDKAHAKNALARVSANGTSAEKAKVKAAVKKRYPGVEVNNESVMRTKFGTQVQFVQPQVLNATNGTSVVKEKKKWMQDRPLAKTFKKIAAKGGKSKKG